MSAFSLIIHGGAGAIGDPERYRASMRDIAAEGARLLRAGAPALDAVAACVALLEDHPFYNAGRGGALNADGCVECDAAIMDGRNLAAGAVAGVRLVKNPILLARAVMENSPHVFLIGEGAERFGRAQGLAFMEAQYFVTEERRAQLAKAKAAQATALDHAAPEAGKLGTVGAAARDRRGELAAATSTGGMTNKLAGRVGDSAVIGAGVWADNASCAISCTGVGEHFLRTSLARTAALFIEERGLDAAAAAREAVRTLVEKVRGVGGLILVDRAGACARAHSTPGMITATVRGDDIHVES